MQALFLFLEKVSVVVPVEGSLTLINMWFITPWSSGSRAKSGAISTLVTPFFQVQNLLWLTYHEIHVRMDIYFSVADHQLV